MENTPADPLVIAVISDIHAYEGIDDDKAPSYCCITENSSSLNPLSGLKELVGQQNLSADIMLCAGDIGDKAKPVAIQHAWRELHEVKKLLKARVFAATTGNHDIDSRHEYNQLMQKECCRLLNQHTRSMTTIRTIIIGHDILK